MEISSNRGLKTAISILAAVIVIIAASFGLLWSGLPYQTILKPSKVENLKAEVTYGQITLTWDKSKHAKGYEIFEVTDSGEQISIGTTGKSPNYGIKDYEKDKAHSYRVAAFAAAPLNIASEKHEGELSDSVEVIYDSSKYAQKIPVLSYHQIIPDGQEPRNSIFLKRETMEEQLKYLNDNGFTTLTMDEFRQWYFGEKEFPVKSCVLTFDDGFSNVYYLAYPVLKKYGQAATIFCIGHNIKETTDEFVDGAGDNGSRYIGTDVINKVREEYPRLGFESHTYDMHARIDGEKPVNVLSYDQMVEDCDMNRKFGFKYIAYPWGTYTDDMKKAVEDTGYKMGFTYRPFHYATRDDDLYAVSRIKVNSRKSMDEFIKIVNGEEKEYDQ